MTCGNATPTCLGTYRDRYTFSGVTVTWVYTGNNCLGTETDKGTATKLPFLSLSGGTDDRTERGGVQPSPSMDLS